MKKVVSFILAAVLCLGMITTVVASNKGFALINSPVIDNSVDSPSIDNSVDSPVVDNSKPVEKPDADKPADDNVAGPNKVVVDPNKVVGLDGKPIGAKQLEDVYTEEELAVILTAGKGLLAGGVDAYADIWVPDETEGTILVPIDVTEKAVVKAYVYKNNVWKAVEGKFYNANYAAVTSDSYCPVRVTVDYDPVVGGTGNNTTDNATNNSTGTTSPKTGEANMTLYIAMLGVIALGGVVYGKRRAR